MVHRTSKTFFLFCLFCFIFVLFFIYYSKSTTNSSLCYQSVKPLTNIWYRVPAKEDRNDNWTILVHSAFYDHRIDKVVIFIASDAANLMKEGQSKPPYTFICQMFYKNNPFTFEIVANFYTSYMLYCPLPNGIEEIPISVSVHRNDLHSNWIISVTNLRERQSNTVQAKKLAVCVGILFSYQSWIMILQFIEFHRIQGVERFYFFYSDLHWSTQEIFSYYQKFYPDLIQTLEWNPDHYTCSEDVYSCQTLRDNYCTYSTMYKFKYVAHCDIDELFTPANGTLVDLLERLDHPKRGSFIFRAKYQMLLSHDVTEWDEIGTENVSNIISNHLPLIQYNNMSTFAPIVYSPKAIAKPEMVLKRWAHYVRAHINGASPYMVKVKTEGHMRHFKVQEWWGIFARKAEEKEGIKFRVQNIWDDLNVHLLRYLVNEISKRVMEIKKIK